MADELIQQVARDIGIGVKGGLNYDYADFCRDAAKAAIAAMQPHIAARCEDAAQAERAAVVDAMKGPLAWLERWARHIGDCPGNIDCTCGLSFARMELRTAIEAGEHHD